MSARSRRRFSAGAIVGLAALAAAAQALAGSLNGSPGVGDPFFPEAGNGGYQVTHYDLDLRYRQRTKRLDGTAGIDAVTTQALATFDLDLRDRLEVQSVEVDGQNAGFSQAGQELVITPATQLADGAGFHVEVAYGGKPRFVLDPDGSEDGWVPTSDGAVVVNEPQGAPTWFPCNDHPSDKATFDARISVPKGRKAISNGTLENTIHKAHRTTFVWHEPDPMATYLSTATIGRFHLDRSHAAGVPSYVAVAPGRSRGSVDRIGDILDFFSARLGPYPFNATGAIIDPSGVGYALEVQTKPYFTDGPGQVLLAHELSHQWFGDSVSLQSWPDIWLNEGFATWAEWRWGQHAGGATTAQRFADNYAVPGSDDGFWNPPPADPGDPAHLFDGTVYERGGMTLELLRQQVGNATFFDILRAWTADHEYANADTQDFIDLAEAESGMDLGQFFQDWLYEPGKPPLPPGLKAKAAPSAPPSARGAPRR